MTSRRPYSGPRPVEEALDELRRCAAAQFDPVVVEAFCRAQAERPPDAAGLRDGATGDAGARL